MTDTAALDRIGEKVEQGERLAEEEARQLASTRDILALGSLADRARRRKHGAATTFLRVAEVPVEQAAGGSLARPAGAREVRLAGGLPSLETAVKAVRGAAAMAGGLPVSGFSLAALEALATAEHGTLASVLSALRDAGLTSLAEAPIDALTDWRGALEAASACAVAVPRLTIDSAAGGIVPLLERVSEACRLPGVSPVFAPLPRRPGLEPTTGYEDVKSIALARLLLDIDHIQVDWRLHGPKLAQVALTVGADDVDNVAADEEHKEGRRRAPLEEILRNIRAAGLEPAERDASFSPVR